MEGEYPLFKAEGARGRVAYKLYAGSVLVGILLIWYYRATHIPEKGGRWAWLGLFGTELWFGFYWIITQSVRWNPIYYSTYKNNLLQRFGNQLPMVDMFVCTADPVAEPPTLVMSTILSLMAYDYPPEKLSLYLSDDGGSILTFYAMWEVSHFAKHWLPYCRKFSVEPRSPDAYFSQTNISTDEFTCNSAEYSSIKKMYEEMTDRINKVLASGMVPKELSEQKGFCKWTSGMTLRNHPSIVQILIDGRDESSTDMDGEPLPTLVYMAREKSPKHHHNFKAGAMNALIRVSSEVSNAPIILNVDCDMYAYNPESIKDALCFFLDEKRNHDLAFVQYPQYFDNITKNDLYGSSFKVINQVEVMGFNNWGGPMYIGTGCFHRREPLCGRAYSKDYKEDWSRGADQRRRRDISTSSLEERAEALVTCTYEYDTLWGKEVGVKYGCPVEDVFTGLSIQCKGWRSIAHNPSNRGFMGKAPPTLEQLVIQHRRWADGNFQIFLSKYCTFIQGHNKISLGLQMSYSVYSLWAPNSIATLYHLTIAPVSLLKSISLYPKVSSPWLWPFAYVMLARQAYSLVEALLCDETVTSWWNSQRIWIFKRLSAYLFGTMDVIFKLLGLSTHSFAITSKGTEEGDMSKRYEQEVMELASSSPMFMIIATIALINLVCFAGGLLKIMMVGAEVINTFLAQILLCGLVVALNVPIYEGMFLRKDTGRLPPPITLASICFTILACFMPIL